MLDIEPDLIIDLIVKPLEIRERGSEGPIEIKVDGLLKCLSSEMHSTIYATTYRFEQTGIYGSRPNPFSFPETPIMQIRNLLQSQGLHLATFYLLIIWKM